MTTSKFFFLALLGCVSDTNTGTDGGVDTGVADGSPLDQGVPDTGMDAQDTGIDAGPVYSDITDQSKWEIYDLSPITGGKVHFVGGTFDGKHVYFSPEDDDVGRSGVFTRYDSTLPFAQASSWEKYDLTTKDPGLKGFSQAVFDGSYVYLPSYGGAPGVTVRYKTGQPFASAGSYETVDLVAMFGATAQKFTGGAFDGKYVYNVPCTGGSGRIVRFDKAASFTASASFGSYTIANICYVTASYDGKYIYYIPFENFAVGPAASGLVVRYDTAKAIDDNSAYLSFDTAAKLPDPAAKGYGGAVFDGRYIYLMPGDGDGAYSAGAGTLVVRYDTKAAFDVEASWTKFDLKSVSVGAHGYNGGTFDGRYIYFAPRPTSLAMRYDTTQSFGSTSAWQAYDLGSINVNLKSFYGAVFDGANVYFVPYAKSIAVRFHARTPSQLPAFASSFY